MGWLWLVRQRVDLAPAATGALVGAYTGGLALFFLFGIMLPIALWAAPESLRQEFSWPRAYILSWSFCLFWLIVTYSSLDLRYLWLAVTGFMACTVLIAAVAPLGISWLYKFQGIDFILQRVPSPLRGVFQGADSGFHPNQVAGTLLYGLPLMIVVTAGQWRNRAHSFFYYRGLTLTLLVLLVFLATQSRAGLLGLGLGLGIIALVRLAWGRWLLLGALLLFILSYPLLPPALFELISDAPPIAAVGGTTSLGFRQEVWTQAINAAHDFPFTGVGLGTFRNVVRLLYPLNVAFDYDIAHAHNFFLQSALDFGLPGLIALLAIYLVAIVRCIAIIRRGNVVTVSDQGDIRTSATVRPDLRLLGLGLLSVLVAQSIYSQLDAVAMGAKTNFLFWYLLALILGLGNLLERR